MNQDYRLMASMALFRELHDQERDIYQIVAVFVKQVIWDHKLEKFTATEITRQLNAEYGFDLKEAIVKVALKRLNIKNSGKFFQVKHLEQMKFADNEQINTTLMGYERQNQMLLETLMLFVQEHCEENLDLSQLQRDFLDFLMTNGIHSKYSEYVSAFVVECSKWPSRMAIIDRIKEGNLLYEGIRMNDNTEINELGSWKESLDIFLEMDVLFYLGGFSGSVYQSMILDVLQYVEEINAAFRAKNSKKRIRLYYFPEVKEEIDLFFERAEKILRRHEMVDPTMPAMQNILDGCREPSDVVEKENVFFQTLAAKNVREYKPDRVFYKQEDYNANIESWEAIEENVSGEDKEKIPKWLQRINYIGFLRRKQVVSTFEQAGYITLTNNNGIMRLERNLKLDEKVRRVCSMDYLINKFWFQLNKGFGQGRLPKSMGVLTKAQLVLSTELTKTVTEQYDKLRIEYDQGRLSREDMAGSIMMLRKKMKAPEDITADSAEETIRGIKETDIEVIAKEYEYTKVYAREQERQLEDRERELQAVLEEKQRVQEELTAAREQNRLHEEAEQERTAKRLRRKQLFKRILLWVICLVALTGMIVFLLRNEAVASYIFGTISAVSGILGIWGEMRSYWMKKKR